MAPNKGDQKHLTLSDRILIEKGLNGSLSFTEIGRQIHKDPTTVSKGNDEFTEKDHDRRERDYISCKCCHSPDVLNIPAPFTP